MMNRELKLWQFAAERLARGELLMLLVVAESSGSSPGRQGFKMIVAKDDLAGSIGGGLMEINLVEQARELLGGAESSLVKIQVHRRKSAHSSGMICSGEQTVIFFTLNGEHLKLIRKFPTYLKSPCERYLRITRNSLIATAKKRYSFNFKFKRQANEFVYEEKFGYKNELIIVGGGHCALALSELMSKMDFYITLFDDRPNLNTLLKNEFVHSKIIVESYEEIDKFILLDANQFVVVMTLGYKSDEVVIRKLLDKNFRYFGVLGSRAKMATLFKQLRKENFPADKLNQIRTPIGLPINSRTPEEIAISIAAEIISVKNKTA